MKGQEKIWIILSKTPRIQNVETEEKQAEN